ncbi:hypothetical protein USDA257_p00780 (plasmid) [Sinorhizobium fredii USDA 257]|uniref:Uncharacterized protein n=1 Tax=Sinorhizobium fredii (strain USDA 257) TaxID=1185652 RepID=I3XFZ0_SINF2|nr:hypothetical protein USDA257_p00780 [Sinorhizobium fredii USDA 257]
MMPQQLKVETQVADFEASSWPGLSAALQLRSTSGAGSLSGLANVTIWRY